jgi:C4-dicarboxylate transporter DctM subunit
MGMITPPFGLTLFACEAVLPNVNAREIMIGRVPFIFSDVCVLAILICFPQIALFIPGLMS